MHMVKIHQNNDYVCIRLGHEYYIHCPQGGSEPGLNSVDNLYIYLQVALQSVSPSLRTVVRVQRLVFRSDALALNMLLAFLSRRTCIAPSTYVYTSFVNDLVLAKSVAIGKTPRQTLWFDQCCTGHIVIIYRKLSESTFPGPRLSPDFSPLL